MTNYQLIIVASLLAFCLCSPQKKSCIRPASGFKQLGEVQEYVRCLKEITGSPPYGKRSLPESSSFFQKLHPMVREYDPDYLEELLYQVLKAERDVQG
ncbi:hypothetical protein D910_09071 [Dendroctonus ponderosae]|uniref:Uncharacterized protein n=1 Tax=Dendroctonus ponderosae TaxID=77166 RepID=U4UNY7_DENPD|nr:hypothetical protein D910_09071 [Dendroctonus ponderosae]KAH1000915.1 hypothetical protein HUJ04_013184 [Dendroctonus ponderosae]KAH1006510.1 hypothetical protein HUJ05_007239 [Dendroctonus ponderosae]